MTAPLRAPTRTPKATGFQWLGNMTLRVLHRSISAYGRGDMTCRLDDRDPWTGVARPGNVKLPFRRRVLGPLIVRDANFSQARSNFARFGRRPGQRDRDGHSIGRPRGRYPRRPPACRTHTAGRRRTGRGGSDPGHRPTGLGCGGKASAPICFVFGLARGSGLVFQHRFFGRSPRSVVGAVRVPARRGLDLGQCRPPRLASTVRTGCLRLQPRRPGTRRRRRRRGGRSLRRRFTSQRGATTRPPALGRSVAKGGSVLALGRAASGHHAGLGFGRWRSVRRPASRPAPRRARRSATPPGRTRRRSGAAGMCALRGPWRAAVACGVSVGELGGRRCQVDPA